MKWLLFATLVGLVALGIAYEALRRDVRAVAESQDTVTLDAVQKARDAVSADLQGLRDSRAKLQTQIAQQAAEVKRLRVSAAQAGRQVAAVQKAGETLRAAPTDTVIAEATRQGYTVRLATKR